MSRGTATTSTIKQRIVQYHRGGRSRNEISRLVGCSLGVVDRAIENYHAGGRRTLLVPVRCDGCRALLKELPCLYCECQRRKK